MPQLTSIRHSVTVPLGSVLLPRNPSTPEAAPQHSLSKGVDFQDMPAVLSISPRASHFQRKVYSNICRRYQSTALRNSEKLFLSMGDSKDSLPCCTLECSTPVQNCSKESQPAELCSQKRCRVACTKTLPLYELRSKKDCCRLEETSSSLHGSHHASGEDSVTWSLRNR